MGFKVEEFSPHFPHIFLDNFETRYGQEILEMRVFFENMVKDRCPGAEEALMALVNTFVRH